MFSQKTAGLYSFGRTTAVFLIFAIIFCAPTLAQVAGGTMSGTVSDPNGSGIPQAKLAIKNVDPFPRVDHNVPGIGEFPEVTDAAATVPAVPGVIDRVMENGGNAYLFEVVSRTEPSDEDWKSAEKSFMSEYVEQRRAQAWTRYLDQLKNTARIKIDTDQLASAEAPG